MIKEVKNYIGYGYFNITFKNETIRFMTQNMDNPTFGYPEQNRFYCKDLSTFSLEEINKVTIILLNGYLFTRKELDTMIKSKLSDKELSNQQQFVITIRNFLSKITEYANSYDAEVLSKYDNI